MSTNGRLPNYINGLWQNFKENRPVKIQGDEFF